MLSRTLFPIICSTIACEINNLASLSAPPSNTEAGGQWAFYERNHGVTQMTINSHLQRTQIDSTAEIWTDKAKQISAQQTHSLHISL